jgi:hypothetical protein
LIVVVSSLRVLRTLDKSIARMAKRMDVLVSAKGNSFPIIGLLQVTAPFQKPLEGIS